MKVAMCPRIRICLGSYMLRPSHRCSDDIAKPLPAGSYHAGLQGTQPLQS